MTAAMSGPWHYREAERLLQVQVGPYETAPEAAVRVAAAQAHATLALASATAATIPDTEPEDCDAS